MDQAHRILSSKINLKFDYSGNFAKRSLGFFEIKPQSTKISRGPVISKIIPDIALATSKNHK
jgi:hypothetical protein